MATRTKRYEAELKNLDHLLQIIEDEMGPDAQLETKEFTRGGIAGLGGKKYIEIVATVQVHPGRIGSGVRRTIRLQDDWTKPQPGETAEQAEERVAEAQAAGAPAESMIESRRPGVPIGRPIEPSREQPAREAKDHAEAAASLEMSESQPDFRPVAEQRSSPVKPVAQPPAVPVAAAAIEPVASPEKPATPAEKPIAPAGEPTTPPEDTQLVTTLPADIPEPAELEPQPTAAAVLEQLQPQTQAVAEPKQAALKKVIEVRKSPQIKPTLPSKPADLPRPQSKPAEPPKPASAKAEPVPPARPAQPPRDMDELLEQVHEQPAVAADSVAIQQSLERIQTELDDLLVATPAEAKTVAAPVLSPELAAIQREAFDRLMDWNIRSADALKLIEAALRHYRSEKNPSLAGLLQVVEAEMLKPLKLSGGIELKPGKQRVVALVGPTGTGKTSIVAKLAADFVYERGHKVHLISLDTYRIAAVEQLRTYADIMGFPLSVVYNADDYKQAIAGSDAELVLVDTAGRSPHNRKQLSDLKRVLDARPPDEVQLVLAATSRADDLAAAVEAFKPLGLNRLIVAKLDETGSLGALYNLSRLSDAPISYFSTGQAIPEDLHAAQPGFIEGWAESMRGG